MPKAVPCTLSPMDDHPIKNPMVNDQRNYCQAMSNLVRMAIILLGSPNRTLDISEMDLIKKPIKGCILDFVKGSITSVFNGVFERDGAVFFNPVHEQTGHWSNNHWLQHSMPTGRLSLLRLPYIIS